MNARGRRPRNVETQTSDALRVMGIAVRVPHLDSDSEEDIAHSLCLDSFHLVPWTLRFITRCYRLAHSLGLRRCQRSKLSVCIT